MYLIDQSDKLKEILKKLSRRDKVRYEAALNKMMEVSNSMDIQHYKNLRAPLSHLKRVHVDSHFVLTFSIDEKQKVVKFMNFKHHGEIYL